MLWLKAFHIISMVAWFAGLFYLPRLYVYHATTTDKISLERFKTMERKLFNFIMTPAAICTLLFGSAIFFTPEGRIYLSQGWMHIKLTLVLFLVAYHFYLGHLRKRFQDDQNQHSEKFYRWLNEFPTIILIAVVVLVVVKPF